MLNKKEKLGANEKCSRRRTDSECNDGTNSAIVEETMKMVLLGFVLWLGVTFGSHVAPYPLNLIMNTDIMHPPPQYDYPFPNAQLLKKLPGIKKKDVNQSLTVAQFSVEGKKRWEENLGRSGITVKKGSPAHGMLIDGYPTDEAMRYNRQSSILSMASYNLAYDTCIKYNLEEDECASYISTLSLRDTPYGEDCTSLNRFTCASQKRMVRYRNYDGSCNNPKRASWGQALTGYKRLLYPKYEDGIHEPRKMSVVARQKLPSPRLISTSVSGDISHPDTQHTLAIMQWTQFVHHDISHTPVRKMVHTGSAIDCCDSRGYKNSPRFLHPSCLPIDVPANDPAFKNRRPGCMSYVRSVTTYRGDCTFGPAEQMNQATHFMDGSQIYGSNLKEAVALRKKAGGQLKTLDLPHGQFMPLVADPTEKCQVHSDDETCFHAGDVRANTHPQLTSMHTLWMREHNRVAGELSRLNPSWTDEMLYQETRRIVIAELQHITYEHWLPAVVGARDRSIYDFYDTGYNADVDPTVSNSLATAGLHFAHSLLDGNVRLVDEGHNMNASLRMLHHFNKPDVVLQEDRFDQLVRGLVAQASQPMDLHYADDVVNKLYSDEGASRGMDILSLDIQRSRDHALPPYHQYRVLCGMSPVTDFNDYLDVIPEKVVNDLRKVYAHAHDVDLIVGAMAETTSEGSLVGPTLACLISEQFARTRVGDLYFYTHTEQPAPFTKRQLTEIRRASLARVICDNTPSIHEVQKDVFRVPSDGNKIVSCNDIKKINLEAWQDPSLQPDILIRTQKNVNKWLKNKVSSS